MAKLEMRIELLGILATIVLAFIGWAANLSTNQAAMASDIQGIKNVEIERDKRIDGALLDIRSDMKDIKEWLRRSHR